MQAFSDAIRSGALPRLELLALAENAIGDAGVTALAGAITRGALPSCIYIGLSGNPNSDETRQALQDARKNRQNFTVEL
jgi:hypothetical protein